MNFSSCEELVSDANVFQALNDIPEFFLLKYQEASKQATGMQYFAKLSISWNWQSVDLKMSSIVAGVRNAKLTQS